MKELVVTFAELHRFYGDIHIIHEYLSYPDELDYRAHRLIHRASDTAGDAVIYMAMCTLTIGNEPNYWHFAGTTDFHSPKWPRCFLIVEPDIIMPFKPDETQPSFFNEVTKKQFLDELDREAHPAPSEQQEEELPNVSTSSQHSS